MNSALEKRLMPIKEQTLEDKLNYATHCLILFKFVGNQRGINKCRAQIEYLSELIHDIKLRKR